MPRVGGAGGAPSGNAGGVLDGTYPNPSFAADMATQAELSAAQAALDAKRLDQIVAPTADVSLNSQKIIGLATPTASTEAANKAYVDAIASGFDVKMSVRAATTANITLSGAQTIDGVSVIATNRVLVKNQTAASQNGIYVCAAGAWSRATDADTDAEVTAGLFTFVEEGTTYADQGWALATNNPITLGTTALSFTQVAGVSGGGAPTGAAGGVLSGTYPNPGFASDMATQAELDAAVAAHVNDTSAAHTATAIAFTPDGSISATTVQAAIVEVRDEAGVGGGTVDDQTIVTTDNTTNNATTAKHGWLRKLDNSRSHYLGGKGEWNALRGLKQWFVDSGAVSGGDGRSEAAAFTTFAAANAAASPGDAIFILSDLNEDLNITVPKISVEGVGMRIISGSGSSSIAARTVNIGFGAHRVRLENFHIVGHAGFKGVHLACNVATYIRVVNVLIDGTLGTSSTFYPYTDPVSPYTPAGGTGIGGIGVLIHQCENSYFEQLDISNCSIGIAHGTWSTQNTFNKVKFDTNSQHWVQGMYSGPNGSQARSTAFGWGLASAPPNNSYAGSCILMNSQMVGAVGATLTSPPVIDLIGDGTPSSSSTIAAGNTFINVNSSETGDSSLKIIRIGGDHNTFINPTAPSGALWKIEGDANTFIGGYIQGPAWICSADHNRFIQFRGVNGITLNGIYNTIERSNFDTGAIISGSGGSNHMELVSGGTLNVTGSDWQYNNVQPTTLTSFGTTPRFVQPTANRALTYGTTVTPPSAQSYGVLGKNLTLAVTNGTAFTIANPAFSYPSQEMTFDILNSSGGSMGAITWGSKYVLSAAITNPGNGKHLVIEFYYNSTLDQWIETNRTLHV